jgi:hypothetical protein
VDAHAMFLVNAVLATAIIVSIFEIVAAVVR